MSNRTMSNRTMSKIVRVEDLLYLNLPTEFRDTGINPTRKPQELKGKHDKRQGQSAKRLLSIVEEFTDSEDSANLYKDLTNLLQEKIERYSKPSQTLTKVINITPDQEEYVYEYNGETCYREHESPEIINAFLNLAKSMPTSNEQYDSIYSDEELDNL